MKLLLLIVLIVLGATGARAQRAGTDTSDLYRRVDSLVRYQLKFDSSRVPPRPVQGAGSGRFIIRDAATVFPDYPLIIVNNKVATRASLNRATLALVTGIEAYTPTAALDAIYGSEAHWGLVVIRGGRKLSRRLRLRR